MGNTLSTNPAEVTRGVNLLQSVFRPMPIFERNLLSFSQGNMTLKDVVRRALMLNIPKATINRSLRDLFLQGELTSKALREFAEFPVQANVNMVLKTDIPDNETQRWCGLRKKKAYKEAIYSSDFCLETDDGEPVTTSLDILQQQNAALLERVLTTRTNFENRILTVQKKVESQTRLADKRASSEASF